MISALYMSIKFVVRFLFIFTFITALLFGGYLSYYHKKDGIIDDVIEAQLEAVNDDRITISEIEEDWQLDGLHLKVKEITYKDEHKDLKVEDLDLKIDIVKSVKEKTLSIKSIKSKNLKIYLPKNNDVYNESIKENVEKENKIEHIFNLMDQYNINITDIEFSIDNIDLKVPDKSIDISGIKLSKSANSSIIKSMFEDKVESSLIYNIDKEKKELGINFNIDSNRFYFKRLIKLLGKEDWLNFIYFDDIYSVVGDLSSNIELKYNYKTKAFSDDYKASILLNGNKIVLNAYDSITLTNAKGYLFYDKKGFYSNDIIANLDRKKTILTISQENKNKDITFKFKTKADLEKLSEIAQFPLEKVIEGSASFSGEYKLNFDEIDTLVVESDFDGIDYNSSLDLKNKDGFKLNAFFDYQNDKINFDIIQGDHEFKLNIINGEVYNTSIGINKSSPRKKDKGIFVSGYLEDQDLVKLVEAMNQTNERFASDAINANEESELIVVFSLKNSRLSNETFENIDLIYQNKTLSLTFEEENAVGSFYYNENTKEIDLTLKGVSITEENDATDIVKDKIIQNKQTIEDIDYSKLLSNDYLIKLDIQDLNIGSLKNINIKTSGETKDGILKFEDFIATDDDNNFEIAGIYEYDSNINKSSIKKKGDKPLIAVNDFENFVNKNLVEKVGMETKGLVVDGNLNWSGFKFKEIGKTLSGDVSLSIGEGFIDKNTVGMGLLKTLNLFNFDSWLKMFSFNFEEIEEGLHFNSIKGSVNIKNNIMSITPRITLDSDLFILEFKGHINYVESIYNVDIEAIVPLLNKVPAVALFTGVAPEIVGIIWLVDKIAGDQINDAFTRSKFNVSGSFDNPIYTKNEEEFYEVEKPVQEETRAKETRAKETRAKETRAKETRLPVKISDDKKQLQKVEIKTSLEEKSKEQDLLSNSKINQDSYVLNEGELEADTSDVIEDNETLPESKELTALQVEDKVEVVAENKTEITSVKDEDLSCFKAREHRPLGRW